MRPPVAAVRALGACASPAAREREYDGEDELDEALHGARGGGWRALVLEYARSRPPGEEVDEDALLRLPEPEIGGGAAFDDDDDDDEALLAEILADAARIQGGELQLASDDDAIDLIRRTLGSAVSEAEIAAALEAANGDAVEAMLKLA